MRTHTQILKRINHNLKFLKLLLIILLLFNISQCFKPTQTKATETTPTQKADILENLSPPPKIIPELEGIDLQTIINAESI